jgi:DNA (cytosine-5)-methyltransferase 1
MTFKPLEENLGEELLTLYLEAFHVPTFPQQEKEQELMEKPLECGEKWRGSFTKYDPDTSLWRTHQCSLLGDLEEFSETWPQWGLMRDGECWEQRTLEHRIRGTGYGLSPNGVDSFHTPNTTGLDGGSNSRKALRGRMEKLPTPTASDHRSQPTSKSWKAKGAINYKLSNPEIQAKWPTPQSRDYKGSSGRSLKGMETDLPTKVKQWPTPDANCGIRGTQPNWVPVRKSGQPAQYSINQAVRDSLYPTPCSTDYKGSGKNGDLRDRLDYAVERGATKSKTYSQPPPTGGQLNPTWVEWLMGWPLGWTDLKPLEMDKSHCVQVKPLES